MVNKSMYSWSPEGFKCVEWLKEYPAMNCAESAALALVIYEDLKTESSDVAK